MQDEGVDKNTTLVVGVYNQSYIDTVELSIHNQMAAVSA
jgi:hypothetical protein